MLYLLLYLFADSMETLLACFVSVLNEINSDFAYLFDVDFDGTICTIRSFH